MSTNAELLTTGRAGPAPTLGLLVDRLQNEYAGAIVGRHGKAVPHTPDFFAGVGDQLIGSADTALYAAKKLGGGQMRPGDSVSWPEPTS